MTAPVSLTPAEVASLTGLTLSRVMQLIRGRQLKSKRIGRNYLVPYAEVQKFIAGLPDA